MADLTAPVPGHFDAQAPGLTAASGTAPQKLEDDIQALEQQLADLQVMSEIWCTGTPTLFGFFACRHRKSQCRSELRSHYVSGLFPLHHRSTCHADQSAAKTCRSRPCCSLQQIFQSNSGWYPLCCIWRPWLGKPSKSHLAPALYPCCLPHRPFSKLLTHIVDAFK